VYASISILGFMLIGRCKLKEIRKILTFKRYDRIEARVEMFVADGVEEPF
jgi:hypothetical protein